MSYQLVIVIRSAMCLQIISARFSSIT